MKKLFLLVALISVSAFSLGCQPTEDATDTGGDTTTTTTEDAADDATITEDAADDATTEDAAE